MFITGQKSIFIQEFRVALRHLGWARHVFVEKWDEKAHMNHAHKLIAKCFLHYRFEVKHFVKDFCFVLDYQE
jgi:hypothetical protein